MNFELLDEQELVEEAKRDANAFGCLFERHYDKIFNYALQRTSNAEIARDITAETFFKALKNIRTFMWKDVPFSAWLYKISTNEIAAYYRKGVYRVTSMDDLMVKGFDFASPFNLEEEMITAEKVLKDQNDLQWCREAIKELPQKYQDVIALRYFADKKINEIAMIVGKPEGTVKSLLNRGVEKIKRKIITEGATF